MNDQYMVVVLHPDKGVRATAKYTPATREIFKTITEAKTYKQDMLRHGHEEAHIVPFFAWPVKADIRGQLNG